GDGQVVAPVRAPGASVIRTSEQDRATEPHLAARGAHIAAVFAKHGLKELFGRGDGDDAAGRTRQARRLRAALEGRGRTFAKLGLFAEKVGDRRGLRQVIDMHGVFEHLSTSLQRELDFRQEASNIGRMRGVLAGYPRLGVPNVYSDLSTSRFLVMEEIRGGP